VFGVGGSSAAPPDDAADDDTSVDTAADDLVAVGSAFTPIVGERFSDTRTGATTIDGQSAGSGLLTAGADFEIPVAGRGSVPQGAVGILANLAAVNPTGKGFFTSHDCQPQPPNASSINYAAGVTVANEVFIPLSGDGTVCVFSSAPSHLLLDVTGVVMPGDKVQLSTPQRFGDSRATGTTFDGEFEGFGRTTPGSTTKIQIADRGGVPAEINSAIVNVAVVGATTNSFITVHACLPSTPTASSINHTAGVNRANELVVEVDSNGDICVYTEQDVDFIVDVAGYVEAGTELVSIDNARYADTRDGEPTFDGQDAGGGPLAPGSTTEVQIGGRGDVPDNAVAAIINVAAVAPAENGFFTLEPCTGAPPAASSINYTPGVNGANEIIVPLDSDGNVCLFTSAQSHALLDVTGHLEPIDLQILAINDFHGNIASTSSSFGGTGRADFLAANMAAREADAPGHTIQVSAGDLIGASPLISALFHDEPTIEAMNLIGLDINGVGNHEFDEGPDELLRMAHGGTHPVDGDFGGDVFRGADFDFLAANVVMDSTGDTIFPSFTTRNYQGIEVAYIGLTLEGTPTIVTPSGVAGLTFLDEAETVNALVPVLQRSGIESIVILLHEGGLSDGGPQDCGTGLTGPIADIVPLFDDAVDLVVAGHTNDEFVCEIDGKWVTMADTRGRLFTDIDVTLNQATRDMTIETIENVSNLQAGVTPDAQVTELIDRYDALSAPLANQVIGSITADILRAQNAAGESALGDVIADAQLDATDDVGFGEAVVAFMNPGGIREDLLFAQISGGEAAGEVTYGEAFSVQPFGNSLVTMTLTGAQIDELLEQQFDNPSAGNNRILQVSDGFTYTWDSTAATGSKVDPTTIMIGGVVVDPAADYRVTVNSFLADGGDNFSVLVDGTDRLGGEIDLDALVTYFGANSPVPPGPQDRITVTP
jgi:5'-nucleotidase